MCDYSNKIMRTLHSDDINNVYGGSVFALSLGLLLGALATRGYDFYLEATDESYNSEEEDQALPISSEQSDFV